MKNSLKNSDREFARKVISNSNWICISKIRNTYVRILDTLDSNNNPHSYLLSVRYNNDGSFFSRIFPLLEYPEIDEIERIIHNLRYKKYLGFAWHYPLIDGVEIDDIFNFYFLAINQITLS